MAQSTTSPPLVVIDLLAATEISPEDLRRTSPLVVPAVVFRFPLIEIVPALTETGPANVRAAAVNTSVVTVRPVNGEVPPNAPVNVASPVPLVLTVSVLAPLTVELKVTVPLLVVVRVVFTPKVTAPV